MWLCKMTLRQPIPEVLFYQMDKRERAFGAHVRKQGFEFSVVDLP
jgi:hypothetical protein